MYRLIFCEHLREESLLWLTAEEEILLVLAGKVWWRSMRQLVTLHSVSLSWGIKQKLYCLVSILIFIHFRTPAHIMVLIYIQGGFSMPR